MKIKLILLMLFIILINNSGCSFFNKQDDKADKKAIENKKIEQKVDAFILKYDANYTWNKEINNLNRNPFTIDLNNILVKSKQPIALMGSINDIYVKNNQYFIDVNEFGVNDLLFKLSSTNNLVEKVINQKTKFLRFDYFIFIVNIKSLYKVPIKYKSNNDYPEIIVDCNDDNFIIDGECIDLLFIGCNFPKKFY